MVKNDAGGDGGLALHGLGRRGYHRLWKQLEAEPRR